MLAVEEGHFAKEGAAAEGAKVMGLPVRERQHDAHTADSLLYLRVGGFIRLQIFEDIERRPVPRTWLLAIRGESWALGTPSSSLIEESRA